MALNASRAVMWLCDVQTAFRSKVSCFNEVTQTVQRLTAAATILKTPLIVTEHHTRWLGHTLEELDISRGKVFEKTKFSGVSKEMKEHLGTLCEGNVSDIVLFGLQAHICVQKTCLDLLEEGYKVHIVADATSSMTHTDRMLAFELLRHAGAAVTSSESILFSILGDSKHQDFREVSKLFIESIPDQGLYPKQ